MLNQAIFARIWVIDADRVDSERSEPARLLVEAQPLGNARRHGK